ncbi:transcription initiation factor IID TAF10 domain-containing protein [Phanerochaete sordida]|uniref:Transcription initiation factor TFIID subunit 10 n=1 Tax=Phanerochaete sordida TaxID=48140 RepID=A0A9P3G7X2_9APHY|nr:transcription initiation factor IID TAF10 domain-containing protein [Phanerochaete sordida]
MATPYQDAAASHTGTPYTYAPPAPAQSPQVATPDPAQYASTSQPQMSATPTPYQYTPTPAQPASQPQPQPQTQQSQTAPAAGPSRRPDEEAKKDRTLAEFLLMLDDYEPLIPNEVTDYYLQRVGFECEDVRLKRLLSLAAQKFVSDIAADAYQHARLRTNATGGRSRAAQSGPQAARDKTKTTLMMEDLTSALAEYGITSRKPDFYM